MTTTTTTSPELNPRQKRQATLLYHFASLNYLKGLRSRIDALAVREVDFKKSVVKDIALRAREEYHSTRANEYSRRLSEYSTLTPEVEAVFRYAGEIDAVMGRPPSMGDFTFWITWNECKSQFPELPKFRVRTDIKGRTDKVPPRTGVYVPQDDVYGALQFGWTGGGYGKLCDTNTFNEIGLEATAVAGGEHLWLWDNGPGLLAFAKQPKYEGVFQDLEGNPVTDEETAVFAIAQEAFVARPCKWYFVEMIQDEFEDPNEPPAQSAAHALPGYSMGQSNGAPQ